MIPAAPWEQDEPTLSEQSGIRYLHFGTEWIQGAMHLRKPDELVLAYTKQMMAWLLFHTPARDQTVGILGLGAGALLRFTLRHTAAQVQTVEWNPAVTALCQAWFRLPQITDTAADTVINRATDTKAADTARSRIVQMDAGDWVHLPQNIARCTALMVDLYDAQAQGPVHDSLAFYRGCRQTLLPGGVLSVNLFGAHESFARNLENIRTAFADRVLMLPEVDEGNRVVLAFREDEKRSGQRSVPKSGQTRLCASGWPPIDAAALLDRAQALEVRTRLPALRWARHLLAQWGQGLAARKR